MGYSIVRTDPDADVASLLAAAEARGMPIRLVDLDKATAADVYTKPLTIVRPDLHVFWRGEMVPAKPEELVDLMCGKSRIKQKNIA